MVIMLIYSQAVSFICCNMQYVNMSICHDVMMLWSCDVMMLWCYYVMMLWCYDVIMLWCYYVMMLWCHGCVFLNAGCRIWVLGAVFGCWVPYLAAGCRIWVLGAVFGCRCGGGEVGSCGGGVWDCLHPWGILSSCHRLVIGWKIV